MYSKFGKLTGLFIALILGLMMSMPLGTIKAQALGDLNISMSGGNLTVSGDGFNDAQDSDNAWNKIIEKYKKVIMGVSGIGTVTMIAIFIFNFLKLGSTSTNPSERAKVLQGLIWSAVAAAGLGSVVLIVGFFYGAMK